MTVTEATDEVRTQFQQMAHSAALLRTWQAHYVDALAAQQKAALLELAAVYTGQRESAQAEFRQRTAAADASLADETAQIHARWQTDSAGFAWLAGSWAAAAAAAYTSPPLTAPTPSSVRIGRLRLAGDPGAWDMPALAPLLGQSHVLIDARGDAAFAAASRTLLQSILLRLVLTCPPRRVQLTLCEPGGAGSLLAGFLHLPQEQRGPRVFVRPDELIAQLAQISEHITHVAQERLRNVYATVEDYNAANPATAVPYRVLVIAGLPAGCDERTWAALLQVARTGPAAGVYLLATLDSLTPPARNINLADLTALCTPLRFTATDCLLWQDAELGEFAVTPDAPPPAAQMNAWLTAAGEGLTQTTMALDFAQIMPPPEQRWTGSSRDGLDIPIGLDSTGAVHRLQLGRGVIHHGLLGGAPGSGKSNLLHVLIMQLALTYSPDEVELYLLDFREGVEFQDYVSLPHARVVALESEREFALSILERLKAEMTARGDRFRPAGVQLLADYVGVTGRPFPRILLIIDEFQVLFSEEDALARQASGLLDSLTRVGRGFGIHVLLSSQTPTISGLYGRTLYEQMGLRMALRCTPMVSQAVLGDGNVAASQLSQVGRAIVNDGLGAAHQNREVQVALLPAAERRAALAAVRTLAHGRGDPPAVTFAARAPARLEANPELQAALTQGRAAVLDDGVQIWLGEPIAIKAPTAARLDRYEASNLLIIGGDEDQAFGLLTAAVLSVAAQRDPAQAQFLVGDFSRPTSRYFGLFGRLNLPHRILLLNARQLRGPDPAAPAAGASSSPAPGRTSRFDFPTPAVNAPPSSATPLDRLEALITERWAQMDAGVVPDGPAIYLVLAGLHAWRDLRPVDFKPSPAAEQALRIAARGPEVGVHVIAWADSYTTLEQSFKRGSLAHFDHRAILRVSEPESNNLLGSPLAARLPDGRALYRFEGAAQGVIEKFKPYVVPEATALTALVAQIRDAMRV
ncbi:FtsK/SpoIIIE domain-containing protein [Candidatus Amarolinea aalborgensis]|uniref:FtsK/SpoIIIE domain-containing protein n=1 Tax=Candidatus Amarolinea aalborgensis TaxID=2249329 RepID=UPI003BF9FDD7